MRYFFILLFLVLLFSCTKPVRPNNEIIKIELARSGAWSDQGAAISIDSALNYKYYGLLNGGSLREKRKYYTGKISEQFWDTLNSKFKKLKSKELTAIDNEDIADANYLELIIHWKTSKTRSIKIYSLGKDSLTNTLIWLDTTYKMVSLKQVDTIFHFEVTFQNPPPKPQVGNVKFPPPIKNKHFTK